MSIRACSKVNPGLWAQFTERRKVLGEPEPKPADWTSPAVSAWLSLYPAKKPAEVDYAHTDPRPRKRGAAMRRDIRA